MSQQTSNLRDTAANTGNNLNQPGSNTRNTTAGAFGNNDYSTSGGFGNTDNQNTGKSFGATSRPLDNNQGSMLGGITGRDNNNQGSLLGGITGRDNNNQGSMFGRDHTSGDNSMWNSQRGDGLNTGYGSNPSNTLGGHNLGSGYGTNNPSGTGVGGHDNFGLTGQRQQGGLVGSSVPSDHRSTSGTTFGSGQQGPTAGHGNNTGFGNTGTTTSGMGNNTSGYGTATGHTTGPTTSNAGMGAAAMLGRGNQFGSSNVPQQQQFPGQQQNFPGQQQNLPGQQQNLAGQQQNLQGQPQNLQGQQQNLGQQQQFRGGETIMDRVVRDHNEIIQIANEYRNCTLGEQRYSVVMNFIRAMSIHSFAEEMAVYPLYEKHFATGRELAARARKEHNEIKRELSTMTSLKNDEAELEARMTRVIQCFEEHKIHEETNELPMLMSSLGQEESIKVGEEYERYKSKAPTRPHPGAPDKGGLAQAAAGMATKPIDSMKDMASKN